MIITTEQERQILIQILDIATKAGGLNVAKAALTFAERVANYQIPQPKKEKETDDNASVRS